MAKRHNATPRRPARQKTTKRRSRRRTAAERERARAARRAQWLAEGSPQTGSADTAERRLPPSFWRYLRAKMACLEAGQAPTNVNLAKQLGVSRVAVWKLQRRHERLDPWCDDVMRSANAQYWGAIERRMAILAMQGSIQAADQFCKMQGGYYSRPPADGERGVSPANHGTIINLLVPRPELPPSVQHAGPVIAAQPAVDALALRHVQGVNIPTVAAR